MPNPPIIPPGLMRLLRMQQQLGAAGNPANGGMGGVNVLDGGQRWDESLPLDIQDPSIEIQRNPFPQAPLGMPTERPPLHFGYETPQSPGAAQVQQIDPGSVSPGGGNPALGFRRPTPPTLTQRDYEFPDPVGMPTLPQAPTRDIGAENQRALKSALIPAGLGLLLGGAPAALAGATGAMQGARSRADQEAAVAGQKYNTDRSNALTDYQLKRQRYGDEMGQVSQQIRADSSLNAAKIKAYNDELDGYNKDLDRLQKAFDAAQNRQTREQIAEMMNQTRNLAIGVQALLGNRNATNAEARTGIMDATQKANEAMGNAAFGLKAEDTRADNTRADKVVEANKWYRMRSMEIAQGRLNFAMEKSHLEKSVKEAKDWTSAMPKIADYYAKAARLGQPDELLGTMPTEDELVAAELYKQAATGLEAKFGKKWNGTGWDDAKPAGGAPAKPSGYDAAMRGINYPPTVETVKMPPNLTGKTQVAPTATPAPSIPSANNRLKAMASGKTSKPAPKTTPTPKPATTPKPAFLTKDPKTLSTTEKEQLRLFLRKGFKLN